jgi:hypothetical protein
MHRKHILILLMISYVACSHVYSQEQILYKQIDTTKFTFIYNII